MISTWDNNYVQFARLLAEIHGKISAETEIEVMKEMDLDGEELESLFNRAEIEWMRIKEGKPLRKKTPAAEIEAFTI